MAPPNDPSQAITNTKSAFLASQIRLLSTPLTTPDSTINITTSTDSNADTSLPSTVQEKLLSQTNKKILAHNRLVYSLESQRHVVEQIDGLYWRDVLAAGLPIGKAETVVKRNIDLTDPQPDGREGIALLPDKWHDVVIYDPERASKRRRIQHEEHNMQEGENTDREQTDRDSTDTQDQERAQHYATLRNRLTEQHARREKLRRKMSQLKQLEQLLRPFENPQKNVQPNLVTRDNKALENELSRMRVLLARVGGAIESGGDKRQEGQRDESRGVEGERTVLSERQRLEDVLGLG